MARCAFLLALLLLCGCSSSLPACPLPPLSEEEFKAWHNQMLGPLAQWEDLPDAQKTIEWSEAHGMLLRRMYTFSWFNDHGMDGEWFGYMLVTPLSPRGTHTSAAQQVSSCTGYELYRSRYIEGRTYYYFLRPSGAQVYDDEYLADWALQTYPEDFSVGQWWADHNQGAGGDF